MASQSSLPGRDLPPELLEFIFSYLELPSPDSIGRGRWEHLKRENDEECGTTLDMNSKDYFARLATNDGEYASRLKTLSSLTRTSQKHHKIATPLLYKTYPGQRIANMNTLLRTLVNAPRKRDLVKRMVLDPFTASQGQFMNSPGNRGEKWTDSIARLGISNGLINHLQSFARSEADVQDAQVGLLFFLCTNIETLDVTASFDWHMGLMAPLLAELSKPGPQTLFRGSWQSDGIGGGGCFDLPLRKLKNLSLRLCDTNYVAGTGMFDDLIRLPTIQRLTLYRFTSEADVLGQNSNLRELVLWRCTFGWESILAALAHLPKLNALSIIFAGLTCSMGDIYNQDDTEITFAGLSTVLQKYTPLLETLRLDTRELLFHTNSQQLNDLDVSQMPHLKELAVESQALWGDHVLSEVDEALGSTPRLRDLLSLSLEKLTILVHHLQSHPWPAARSAQLIFHKSARFAQRAPAALKEVHLDLLWGWAQYGLTHEPRLRERGWVAEGVVDDVEVARPSPVVGSMTSRVARKKLWSQWSQWEPGRGWETMVLRRVG